ncbi:MAG: endonuclease domain-containing protein [Oscillospiraceae bacterium]|nr:endonuclease domain-containing protein [Oscillospiraceae bacterium]
MKYLETNKNLNESARILRKNMTPEEKHLWYDFLKSYPVQFNRQKVIGNYIVDFYCKTAKVVIEIDGSQHFEKETVEYDGKRTEYLNGQGIEVVRFLNKDIRNNFENTCAYINTIIEKRMG